jgi:hypothetical protein
MSAGRVELLHLLLLGSFQAIESVDVSKSSDSSGCSALQHIELSEGLHVAEPVRNVAPFLTLALHKTPNLVTVDTLFLVLVRITASVKVTMRRRL